MKKLKTGSLVLVDKELLLSSDLAFQNIEQDNSSIVGIIIGNETWKVDEGSYVKVFQVLVNRVVHPIDELSVYPLEEL